MATTFQPRRPTANGPGPGSVNEVRIEPPPRRRVHLPELLVGAALMVGFALAAVVWHMSTTAKEPALALSAPVKRGDVIKPTDVRVVYLSSDDGIARLRRDESSAVVGRTALADMAPGTLLTRASVAPPVSISAGEGVVGLALDPGQVPSSKLLPGELVNVIAGPATTATGPRDGPDNSSAVGTALEPEGGQASVLAYGATVFAVDSIGTQGRKFVSVKIPEADANRVAAAAERGPVRLVLVGR